MVGGGDSACQVESQNQARRCHARYERAQELGTPFRWDAWSRIAHGKDHPWSIRPSLPIQLDCDGGMLGGVFDRIGQQVLQDLPKTIGISRKHQLLGSVNVDRIILSCFDAFALPGSSPDSLITTVIGSVLVTTEMPSGLAVSRDAPTTYS